MAKKKHQRALHLENGTVRKVSHAAYMIARRIVRVGMNDYGWLVLEAHEHRDAVKLRDMGLAELQSRSDHWEKNENGVMVETRKRGLNIRWRADASKPRFNDAVRRSLAFVGGRALLVSDAQRAYLERLAAGAKMRLAYKYDKLGVMVRALERRGIVTIDWTDGIGDVALAPHNVLPPAPPPPPLGAAIMAHVAVCGPIECDALIEALREDRPGVRRVVVANAVTAAINAGRLKYVRAGDKMCLAIGGAV